MRNLIVHLKSINDVKEFVRIVNCYDFEIDLISGSYNIDSKSIMSIFSLDLNNPIEVAIHNDDCDELIKQLSVFAAG
ncbi:MAG: HPr family phosphocarrier protein [Saccharofermentanales bacterium]